MSTSSNQEQDTFLYLHAELLPNIRHITLYISLPANLQPKNIRPEISLSQSRRAVSVSLPAPLDHVADTIKLPARVSEASRRMLSFSGPGGSDGKCENGQREYSFRMQIDNDDESLLAREEPMDGFVPWTAMEMSPATKVGCRQCESVILDSPLSRRSEGDEGSARWVWKDLPSGNWAEMMDFWHCHKPDPHEDDDKHDAAAQAPEDPNATVKGYGAANQVVAIPGTVLVDVATFLVSEVDCKGLKQVQPKAMNDSFPQLQTEIRCEGCESLVGVEDAPSQGWRLFKTSVSADSPPVEGESEGPTWQAHSIETIVAAQLLELIERESARRFVIHCGQNDGLLIWVFNPDLWYSNSSSSHSITAQRAMKALFQSISNVDEMLNPEPGKASSLSLEELRLPPGVFSAVSSALESRNEMLPVSARNFREWRVSVMHRFDRSPRV